MIPCDVTKITVERVFNIGNYQTIRFGMEFSTAIDGNNQQAVTDVFDRALTATEQSFNQIMEERRQVARQFERYANDKVTDAKRDQRLYTEH